MKDRASSVPNKEFVPEDDVVKALVEHADMLRKLVMMVIKEDINRSQQAGTGTALSVVDYTIVSLAIPKSLVECAAALGTFVSKANNSMNYIEELRRVDAIPPGSVESFSSALRLLSSALADQVAAAEKRAWAQDKSKEVH